MAWIETNKRGTFIDSSKVESFEAYDVAGAPFDENDEPTKAYRRYKVTLTSGAVHEAPYQCDDLPTFKRWLDDNQLFVYKGGDPT